ncbi:flagellar export protein FliJ [Massilia yuzhufengensis]|uniref:Flagellar export protein FliJ n=1 Tax=Massilia yuzhufengensis TaxID=1164594 RepID=A0A1I1G9K7_9BURK|nr:flagellar export protein FliJ [Massilia yuzhufengensis]SFC06023.1 flagellar export protein FliJ [Massilia yuzhufengensis]
MSKQNTIDSLGTLVQLRGLDVDRLQADMTSQEATRTRYQNNLARMDALTASSGATGALPLALALNCGAYKQNVMAMADLHRTDLALHEANMAVSQRKLSEAWIKKELLGKVLDQQQQQLSREQERALRKREDDMATQSWMANRTA